MPTFVVRGALHASDNTDPFDNYVATIAFGLSLPRCTFATTAASLAANAESTRDSNPVVIRNIFTQGTQQRFASRLLAHKRVNEAISKIGPREFLLDVRAESANVSTVTFTLSPMSPPWDGAWPKTRESVTDGREIAVILAEAIDDEFSFISFSERRDEDDRAFAPGTEGHRRLQTLAGTVAHTARFFAASPEVVGSSILAALEQASPGQTHYARLHLRANDDAVSSLEVTFDARFSNPSDRPIVVTPRHRGLAGLLARMRRRGRVDVGDVPLSVHGPPDRCASWLDSSLPALRPLAAHLGSLTVDESGLRAQFDKFPTDEVRLPRLLDEVLNLFAASVSWAEQQQTPGPGTGAGS